MPDDLPDPLHELIAVVLFIALIGGTILFRSSDEHVDLILNTPESIAIRAAALSVQ